MYYRYLWLIVCWAAPLFAATAPQVHITKILVVADAPANGTPLPRERIWVDPALLRHKEASPLRKQLRPFLGEPITSDALDLLKEKIARFFFEHQHQLVLVSLPPQEISGGIIRFEVHPSTLDQVTLEGNRWTSNAWLLKQTHLSPGKPLYTDRLENALAWLNRNPFRRTDLILSPGSQPGTTSARLITQERFPIRPVIGGDNTGTEHTAYTRLWTGFQASLIGWDQNISYQFAMAPDPYIFIAHTASYTLPFPWRHQLYTYGGWNRSNGSLPEHLRNRAINWQISPRYQIPLPPLYGKYLHTLSFGYDFKQINNTNFFGSEPLQQNIADVNQIMIGYSLSRQGRHSTTSCLAEIFAAPAQITSDQTDPHYHAIRPFAASRYGYLRLAMSYIRNLPYLMELKIACMAQGTAWNLLPSEMIGIGGYNTVRGYEERGLNVDNALITSAEITSPPLRLFKRRSNFPAQDGLLFLAFIDYGWGQLYHATEGQQATQWMIGVGPGLRYRMGSNITFRADLGFPCNPAGLGRQGIHLHVGGSLAF